MSNAGGAAIHAGVDYQQRVSAIFLIALYSRFNLDQLLAHSCPLTPIQVSYETAEAVDDIGVACKEGTRLLVQAKRSLSLSERESSEFASVIDQFVRAFISSPKGEDLYLLITSSSASQRIAQDLRKILESIRHNDAAFDNNPLSQQETKVLKVHRSVFDSCYKKHSGDEPTEAQFVAFCRRVMVEVWDVEAGMSFEKIAILLLHSKGFGLPHLIWQYLIAQCVRFASQRMSVDHEGITRILDKYKMADMSPDEMEPLINELLAPCLIDLEKMPVGKEVLLVSSFMEDADLVMTECLRFDEKGAKRELIDGQDALLAQGGIRAPIIQRFASREAFYRFCERSPGAIQDKHLICLLGNEMQGVEDSPAAKGHRQFCMNLLKQNTQLSKCLHSGRSCLTSDAYFVELDSPELPPSVGLVRADELRPLDRIMGLSFQEEGGGIELPNFDLATWLAAIRRGQGVVASAKEMKGAARKAGKSILIAWNDANPNASSYSYCIRFAMEDGSFKYCYVRGKVQRFPKYEVEARAKYFNEEIQRLRGTEDALCFSSPNWTFGSRTQLVAIKGPDETISEIQSAEPCKYSDILGRTYNRCDNFYAPVCLIRHSQTDQVLSFGGIVPLVSDPFSTRQLMSNWFGAEVDADDYVLSILKNDHEFDDFMREIFQDQLTPIIDPILQDDALSGGIVIKRFEDIAQENNLKTQD